MYVESGSGTKWSFLYKFAKSDIFQKKFAKQYQQVPQHMCHDVNLHLYQLMPCVDVICCDIVKALLMLRVATLSMSN